jgi:hypothetical protein
MPLAEGNRLYRRRTERGGEITNPGKDLALTLGVELVWPETYAELFVT